MDLPSAMLARLDVETRVEHRDADSTWLDLMVSDVTRARYIEQLIAVYGFEAPVEAALALTPRVGMVLPLRDRTRSGLIVQDLLALGLGPSRIARLPQCLSIVPFHDPAEALGWLYVVERATLLHDPIRRHLEHRMPHVTAVHYLSAYDGVVGLRWQGLGRALDHVAKTPEVADQIVEAAKAGFACHRDWFHGVLVARTRSA